MVVTIYTYPNKRFLLEVPDDPGDALTTNDARLSSEEFKAALDRLAAKAMEFDGPDAPPLSDYAMSRESIYEDHPKL